MFDRNTYGLRSLPSLLRAPPPLKRHTFVFAWTLSNGPPVLLEFKKRFWYTLGYSASKDPQRELFRVLSHKHMTGVNLLFWNCYLLGVKNVVSHAHKQGLGTSQRFPWKFRTFLYGNLLPGRLTQARKS